MAVHGETISDYQGGMSDDKQKVTRQSNRPLLMPARKRTTTFKPAHCHNRAGGGHNNTAYKT